LSRSPIGHLDTQTAQALVRSQQETNAALAALYKEATMEVRMSVECAIPECYSSYSTDADLGQPPTQVGGRLPFLHSYSTYLRALEASNWGDAMRNAASLLDIHGGRYGLPKKVA